MPLKPLFKHLVARSRRRICDGGLYLWMARLTLRNLTSKGMVTGREGPAISLTSYGRRLRTVYLTIESIASGSLRPSKLILWVDDVNAFHNPPATLRRLQRRGLEMRFCNNYGPHTKYFPYVKSDEPLEVPLVTADDDILYRKGWLKGLCEAGAEFPAFINCYLAKEIEFEGGSLAKYEKWKVVTSTVPDIRHIAHGVNGVIFPPRFLEVLRNAGNGFEDCCPKADDVWLHVQAIRSGFKVRQIRNKAKRFSAIPGTQEEGLWIQNNAEGNDRAIAATYQPTDIAILRERAADAQSEAGGQVSAGSYRGL